MCIFFIFLSQENKIFAQKNNVLWEDVLEKELKNTTDIGKQYILKCATAREMAEYDKEKAYKLTKKYEQELSKLNAKSQLKNSYHKEAEIENLLTYAEILRISGHTHQALEKQEIALKLAENTQDTRLIYKVKKDMGNVFGGLTRYSEAQKTLEEVWEWYKKNDPKGRDCGMTVHYLAINTLRQGRYKQAFEYSKIAKTMFENIEDFNGYARTSNALALIQKNIGFKKEALEKYISLLNTQQKIKENHRQMVTLLLNLGNLHISSYTDTLNFQTAKKSYEKALHIAYHIKDTMQIVSMHEALAKYYAIKKNIALVKEHFDKGYFLIQKNNNYLEEGYYLLRISDAYILLGLEEEGINNIKKALKSFEEHKTEEAIIQALGKLAVHYSKKEDFKTSQYYALNAWERAQEKNNQILPYLYVYILENYTGLKEYQKGEEWGTMIEKKLADDSSFVFLELTYRALHKLNLQCKNYEKALYWHQKYHETHLKNNRQERVKNMQEIQTIYDFKNQEKENDFLKKINDISQKQLNSNKIIIFTMGFLLIVVVVVGYFLYYNGKKLKKAMHIIQQNNQEITEQNNEIQTQKEHLDEAMQDLSKLNNALTDKNEALENLNEVKTRIFSMISHDMRNPLGNLKAVFELSQSGSLQESEREFLFKRLAIDVDRVYDFLNTLLFWAKSQMEGFFIQHTEIHAHSKIEKTLQVVENQSQQKNITLLNNTPIDILFFSDKDILGIVLLNLLTNAIKFTKKHGQVSLHTSLKDGIVIFAIKDTGIGIPLEDQPKIFGSHKFTTYGTSKEKGSGFGLSLCKDFVTLLGGKIYFESKENEGTTFFVELPQNLPEGYNQINTVLLQRTLENI